MNLWSVIPLILKKKGIMFDQYFHIDDLPPTQKVLFIYGQRCIGMTILLKEFLKTTSQKHKLDLWDNISVHHICGSL